jgi:hypothetical protein
VNLSSAKPEQFRALHRGFPQSEMARDRAPYLARYLARQLGLVGEGEDHGALGAAAGAAAEGLVAAAMLAWLRVMGCGRDHRVTVDARRRGGKHGGPLPLLRRRRVQNPGVLPASRSVLLASAVQATCTGRISAGWPDTLPRPPLPRCAPAGPAAVHPDFHNVRMTVAPYPPFDDVPPARPGGRSTVLLTCKPGVVARSKARSVHSGDLEAGQQEQARTKVVVQEDVVAAAEGEGEGEGAGGGCMEGGDVAPAALSSRRRR